ncbi:MAG: hypothetical protein R2766_10125 [Saprospiraceae bacterium]
MMIVVCCHDSMSSSIVLESGYPYNECDFGHTVRPDLTVLENPSNYLDTNGETVG